VNKTFYIAGSSKDRELIAEFGNDLYAAGPWEWAWDWTQIPGDVLEPGRTRGGLLNRAVAIARPGLVLHDLWAAATADLFVLYLSPNTSFGGAVELGTRLQAGKRAHVVFNGAEPHLFFEHPSIRLWRTWNDLFEHVVLLGACPGYKQTPPTSRPGAPARSSVWCPTRG
jgi:hypothetical protein